MHTGIEHMFYTSSTHVTSMK